MRDKSYPIKIDIFITVMFLELPSKKVGSKNAKHKKIIIIIYKLKNFSAYKIRVVVSGIIGVELIGSLIGVVSII